MESKKIIPILLFALLLIQIIPFSMKDVYGQAGLTKITGFSHNLLTTGYSNGKIWALATNGTVGTTANNWLYEVNATSQTIDAMYNVTRSVGASAKDMWCSPQYCYITDGNNASAFISAIATITSGGETKGDIEYTVNVREGNADTAGAINGRFSTSGSFSELYVITYDASTSTDRDLRVLNSVPNFGTPTTIDTSFVINPTGNIYSMRDETGVDRRVFMTSSGTLLAVTSLAGPTGLCDFNIATTTVNKILTVVAPDGSSWTGGDPALQELYITGVSASGGIRIVKDTSNWLNCPTATTNYLLDNTVINLGSVGTLNGIILENLGIAVIQESGTSARLSIMNYDSNPSITDPTTRFSNSLLVVNTNPVDSQALTNTPTINQMNYNNDTGHIFWAETGSGRAVVMYDVSSFAPPSPPPPEGNFVPPPQGVPESAGQLLCRSGLLAPDQCDSSGNPVNTDISTNGTGLSLWLIMLVFFSGVVVAVSKKNNFSVTEINPIFWLALVVGTVGISWQIGWIPDIIFYGLMIGIAGLFAFGMYKQFGNRGSSG